MNIQRACAAIRNAREEICPNAPLVTTMSAMFVFDSMGVTERRIDSVPLMGGAAGLGLGVALARPDLQVIVVDGDASLLMELGGLTTVATNKPRKFLHFVCANGVQFNGMRNLPTPGGEPRCDFAAMALAAGYQHAERIDNNEALFLALPRLLSQTGASFVELVLSVDLPRFGDLTPQPLLPELQFVRMGNGLRALRAALAN